MKFSYSTLALTVGLTGVFVPAAFGQDADSAFYRHRFVAVTERQQPQFDPSPLHWGAFQVASVLGIGAGFNDNIYAQQSNKVSDTTVSVTPKVDARSTWARNEVAAGVSVDSENYLSRSAEDVTNFNAYLRGRIDVSRAFSFGGQLLGGHYSEPRYAPSAVNNAAKPVRSDQFGEVLFATYNFSRILLEGRATQIKYDYFDVPTIPATPGGHGFIIDESYRNVTETTEHGRASYAISPSVAVYLQGDYTDMSYRVSNPNRDSNRTYVQVGSNFELEAPFRGDIAVGYATEDRKQALVPGGPTTFSGLSLDGRLQWFPTQITTVTFTGTRTVFDPGLILSSVAFNTGVHVRADHELRRNIVLFGDVGYQQLDYKDIDRTDDITTLMLGAGYKLNRHAQLDVYYSLRNQDTSGNPNPIVRGVKFDQNIIGLGLKVYP